MILMRHHYVSRYWGSRAEARSLQAFGCRTLIFPNDKTEGEFTISAACLTMIIAMVWQLLGREYGEGVCLGMYRWTFLTMEIGKTSRWRGSLWASVIKALGPASGQCRSAFNLRAISCVSMCILSFSICRDGVPRCNGVFHFLVWSSRGEQRLRPIRCMQGLQTLTAEGLYVILRCIGSLAAKDSIFLGELPRTALGDISQVHQASLKDHMTDSSIQLRRMLPVHLVCRWLK